MSDRMACEIWIGGKLPRSLLKDFPISDLRLDWEETPFDASSAEGILAARDESGLLHFADCEAAWGEFGTLEDVASGTQHPVSASIRPGNTNTDPSPSSSTLGSPNDLPGDR